MDTQGLLNIYRRMLVIRRFEGRIEELFRTGVMPGTFHSSLGQEAVAAGIVSSLREDDAVVSNHRGHGHFIAAGAEVGRLAAELFGRADGCCGGRGGTQHLFLPGKGLAPRFMSSGITGGTTATAAGIAFAFKFRREPRIVCVFFGDGGSSQGIVHETMNMASIWKLPLLFICEYNCYAMSTAASRAVSVENVAERAAGYSMPAEVVDGNDVLAVHEAALRAGEYVRSTGPFLLECKTYRMRGHSKSDRCLYRTEDEVAEWRRKCPIARAEAVLRDRGVSDGEIKRTAEEAGAEVDQAVQFASESPRPAEEEVATKVFATPVEPGSGEASVDDEGPIETMTYREALAKAMREEMQRDESVVLIGEDIGAYGGAFGVTKGLLEEFGDQRVIETPISESGFVGMSTGAAIAGMRPVVELMFMDFVLLAFDQLANHAAKFRYMYDGRVRVPLVVRTPAGGYRGYGPTHSQSLEGLFLNVPGLKVVAPFTARDARGLLKTAIRDDDPVLFVEHKLLYSEKGPVPEREELVPFGKANTVREGSDVTLIAHSYAVKLALAAADALSEDGVSAEVIDLRSLSPLDIETPAASVARTQHAVVIEEGPSFAGAGSCVAAQLQKEAFGFLDAPIALVGAASAPIPAAPNLERAVLPSAAGIVAAVKSILNEK